jgi:hypothetical protein
LNSACGLHQSLGQRRIEPASEIILGVDSLDLRALLINVGRDPRH